MDEMILKLKVFTRSLVDGLDNFNLNGPKRSHSFDIDCSTFIDYLNTPIDTSEQFKERFDELKTMDGPCIYWVDLLSDNISSVDVVEAVKRYRNKKERLLPVIYKKQNNSRTLYVGKANNLIWARVLTHFGFHKRKNLQGLQLYHWARQIGLTVRFNIIEFEPGCKNLLAALEYEVAKQKQPLVGAHVS